MVRYDRRLVHTYLLALLAFSALVVLYLLLRFGGKWTGGDTVRMASAARSVYRDGTILPTGETYPHGFLSPTLDTFLIHVTGLPLAPLTTQVLPFLLVLDILVACVAYRALTQDAWVGLLGAFLLAMQPDFLFAVGRGSHEKLTFLLTLLALFSLARSFVQPKGLTGFVKYVFLFYLTAFALITSNSFFASSFLLALVFCLTAAAVLSHFKLAPSDARFLRLVYVCASCTILIFLFMFYLYRPALAQLQLLEDARDKLASLLLNVEAPFDPSAASANVGQAWVSGSAYLALSSPSWLLLLFSAVCWLVLARRLRSAGLAAPVFLLWLLYAGFAAQAAGSVVTSSLGMLASNLQVRFFSVLMLVLMPVAALGIHAAARRLSLGRVRRPTAVLALILVLWASATSLPKATNEPLLSNHWVLRLRAEEQSLQWAQERTRYGRIWLGTDRLRYTSHDLADPLKDRYDIYAVDWFVRYALISRLERTRMLRMAIAQPDLSVENLVYDNGDVEMYQFRPRTPYQR